ncbi:hypothetical protein QL285_012502 [Trifolium repens]|nr:hypothetical protein QL285_012502 [Trifolium repens]
MCHAHAAPPSSQPKSLISATVHILFRDKSYRRQYLPTIDPSKTTSSPHSLPASRRPPRTTPASPPLPHHPEVAQSLITTKTLLLPSDHHATCYLHLISYNINL